MLQHEREINDVVYEMQKEADETDYAGRHRRPDRIILLQAAFAIWRNVLATHIAHAKGRC